MGVWESSPPSSWGWNVSSSILRHLFLDLKLFKAKKIYNGRATRQELWFHRRVWGHHRERVCMDVKIVYRCNSIKRMFGAPQMILAGQNLPQKRLYSRVLFLLWSLGQRENVVLTRAWHQSLCLQMKQVFCLLKQQPPFSKWCTLSPSACSLLEMQEDIKQHLTLWYNIQLENGHTYGKLKGHEWPSGKAMVFSAALVC